MFISFEGVEGSGKSTQLRMLADYLRAMGRSVVCTHEPGGTPLGDALRQVLLDPRSQMEAGTELFLMMASRRELVERVIRPALEAGQVVLSDRYVDASFAYQGYGRGLPEKMIRDLAEWACSGLCPDRTVLLDIDAAQGLARSLPLLKAESAPGQGDRIESCGAQFLERVRRGYLKLAEREPERFLVVPVTGDPQATFNALISGLSPLLDAARPPEV